MYFVFCEGEITEKGVDKKITRLQSVAFLDWRVYPSIYLHTNTHTRGLTTSSCPDYLYPLHETDLNAEPV